MEIYTNEFFNIFRSNTHFDIIDTEMGPAVKMPAREAFIYSSVTGAGYFENPIYPFTPKGLMKLFYNAFNYKFVSGIFDNGVLKNTPYILSQAKKYLFEGDKYIIPVEFESEEKLVDLLKIQFSSVKNPENYIIQRIEISKQGNGMEPFMEYMAGEYFKNSGFIVENQIPLAHAIGSPDFAGFGLGELMSKISNHGYLPRSGFHMIELALLRNFKQGFTVKISENSKKFIVGEAKTGSLIMTKQLEKYLDTGLFDQGFEIHPAKTKPVKNYFGLISLNDDFRLTVTAPATTYVPKSPLSREEYTIWLGNYIKFYLLSNFTNDELKKFYFESMGENINRESDLVSFVVTLEIEEILKKIKSL